MKERREGGSVLGFIAVAIVLVGLLVGGAYFVQQQGKDKPSTAAPTIIDQPKEEEQKPAEQSAPAVPAPQANNSATQPPRELPQGGPVDTLMTVVMMGILVGATISFLQSRRQLAPL